MKDPNEDKKDEVIEQVVEDTTVETITDEKPAPKLSAKDGLKIISNALKAGHLTGKEARTLRGELGILGSSFTKKTISGAKRKAKRKAQKLARQRTHLSGHRGQKMGFGEKYA